MSQRLKTRSMRGILASGEHQRPRSTVEQVKRGFSLAAKILAGLAWFACIAFGVKLVNSGTVVGYSCGGLVLAFTIVVAYVSAHEWVKALPGVFAVGTLMTLQALISGKYGTQDLLISRGVAGMALLLVALSAFLSTTFVSRKLTLLDRVCLVGVALAVIFGAVVDRDGIMGFALVTGFLIVGWGGEFLRERFSKQFGNLTNERRSPGPPGNL